MESKPGGNLISWRFVIIVSGWGWGGVVYGVGLPSGDINNSAGSHWSATLSVKRS